MRLVVSTCNKHTIVDVIITNTYVLLTGRTLNMYGLVVLVSVLMAIKVHGHFTLLKLKASNHLTVHVVPISALHGNSKDWHRSSRQIGH